MMEEDSELKPDGEDAKKDRDSGAEEAPILDLHSDQDGPSKAEEKLIEVDLMREIENFMDGEEEEPVEVLRQRLKELEKDRGQLAAEAIQKDEMLGRLEKEVSSMKAEVESAEEHRSLAQEEAENRERQIREEAEAKVAELKRLFGVANRDKESMVMKYAMGEKEVIIQRKGKEEAERKLKAMTKERDDMTSRAKALAQEKAKAQQIADSRHQDISVAVREVERWQEEVKVQEAKTCQAGSRLKAEVDAHRETKENLDKTIKHLAETREEIESTRKECADFMKKIREEENEASAKCIIDAAAASEMVTLRDKYTAAIDENNSLSMRVQTLERERLEGDEQVSKLKETVAAQNREVSDLLAQVAEMESLRMQLQSLEDKCVAKSSEISRLRDESTEIGEDMAACRRKESELLEFTQKLTDKNVGLQSAFTALEAKAAAVESEHARLAAKVGDLESGASQISVELSEERKRREEETALLARKLAEKTRVADLARQKAVDAENEVNVLKRKNAASLRELTRELKESKKRLDQQSSAAVSQVSLHPVSRVSGVGGSPIDPSSRASSELSLNPASASDQDGGGSNGVNTNDVSNNGSRSPRFSVDTNQLVMPDSQVLVEKIVRLQRHMARKQEKLDFLEEHMGTMTEEVKKKNRIIVEYVMKAEAGILSTENMDENKRQLSSKGGVMASLYSSKPGDSGAMTLDLSLEINRKLQAVLEDTLLKNITLKENINTLGNEISKIAVGSNGSGMHKPTMHR